MDAALLPFEDTIVLDPYVCIDKQDLTTNALGGMRLRREQIARDIAQLNIQDAINTVLRFTDKAKDRRNNISLSNMSESLHDDLQQLKDLIEKKRHALMEEDMVLAKQIDCLLEEKGKYKFRLHAIILHRGIDDRSRVWPLLFSQH